jgi:D-3-phosphoglycerate dehydrogenase
LINTARAGLIDEEALMEALKNKQIGGAALDVFWTEPIAKEHPLLSMDNVTLTPHLAGATNDTFAQTPYLLLRELKRVLDSKETSSWIVN